MARSFDGTNQFLSVASPIVTALPVTMACWFQAANVTAEHSLMLLEEKADGSTPEWLYLFAAGAQTGDRIRAASHFGTNTSVYANSTSGYSANTWHHACGVFASTTSRAAYLDGGNKGTDTTSNAPLLNKCTDFTLGVMQCYGNINDLNGMLAEAAVWNVALTDAEVAMLAKGYSPAFVRPASLMAYWPLLGRTSPEIDIVGGYGLTVTGATVGVHPRVLRPSQRIYGFTPYVAPVVTGRSWAVMIGG